MGGGKVIQKQALSATTPAIPSNYNEYFGDLTNHLSILP
jgi:hypothetical protein